MRGFIIKFVSTVTFLLFFVPISTMAQNSQNTTDSSSGADILYPLPGESITDRIPMITVKLPNPDPGIDIATLKIYVDGSDVSVEAQVNLEYLIYEPKTPMKPGLHGVVIVAKDEAGKDIIPIQWKFKVIIQPVIRQAPTARTAQKDTFRGKYVIRFQDVYLNEASRKSIASAQQSDIKTEEVPSFQGYYEFTFQSGAKSIIGKVDRSITPIQGRSRADDGFSFRIVNSSSGEDTTFGDALVRNTELTINGTNLRGIYRTKKIRKYSITSFAGRTREPQDGRLKRNSFGLIINTKASKSHYITLTGVNSKEDGHPISTTATPITDTIYGVRSVYMLSKHSSLDTEMAMSRHSKLNTKTYSSLDHGSDTAMKTIFRYNHSPWILSFATRNIGPKFYPTVYSTYIETNRKGSYGELSFRTPSKKLFITSKYDIYHNNLHKTLSDTEQTRSGNASVTMDYGWVLPSVTTSFRKQYSATKDKNATGYRSRESTTFSISTTKNIHNTSTLNSTKIQNTYTRSDNDSDGTSKVITRTLQNRWGFSTRYKAFAQLNYSTMLTKSKSATSYTTSRSLSDGLNLQLQIIPFKFVTTLSHNRDMRNTKDFRFDNIKANSLEYDQKISFLYYLNKKKKLLMEFTNYDKEFRATSNLGKSYDEQSVEATYMVDF